MDTEGASFGHELSPDDAARLAAASKRITIQPLSESIAIEALSDAQIAAAHANGVTLANAPIESECTVPPAVSDPAPSDHRSGHVLAVLLALGVIIVAGGILYFVFQSL